MPTSVFYCVFMKQRGEQGGNVQKFRMETIVVKEVNQDVFRGFFFN